MRSEQSTGTLRVLELLGLAIAVIGFTDVALLLLPPDFGSLEWEFATMSAFLDGLPLGTVGIGLLGAAETGLRRVGALRVLAVLCLLLTLVVCAGTVLHAINVQTVFQIAQPGTETALRRAVIKSFVFAATYVAFFAWATRHFLSSAARS